MSTSHESERNASCSSVEPCDNDWIDISNDEFGGATTQTAGVQFLPVEGCNDVLLVIRPPSGSASVHSNNSIPLDLTILLDVSPDMQTLVLTPGPGNYTDLSSTLDLAKDTIRSMINQMEDQDRLTVLTFHAMTNVVEPLQYASQVAKKQIADTVQHVQVGQGSSIMGGLCTALNLFPEALPGRRSAISVVSGGRLSNVSPEDIENLQVLLQTSNRPRGDAPMVSTFGIGPACNSDVLLSIATTGNGTFSLVEDQDSMSAAVSRGVMGIRNAFSTSAEVDIEWNDSKQSFHVPESSMALSTGPSSMSIHLGFLEYGRPHMILFNGNKQLEGTITASLEYQSQQEKGRTTVSELNFRTASCRIRDGSWVARVRFRARLCDLLWRFFSEKFKSKARYELGPAFQDLQDGLDDLIGSLLASQYRTHPADCKCHHGDCERPITEDIDEMYQDSTFISKLLRDDQVRYSLSLRNSRTSAVLATFLHAHLRQTCTSLAIWMVRSRVE